MGKELSIGRMPDEGAKGKVDLIIWDIDHRKAVPAPRQMCSKTEC